MEGIVLIQAIVRKDGKVDSFKILGRGLDESAITTLAKKWRFSPGTFNGEPVDVQINIEVSFRLFPGEVESLKSLGLRVQIFDTILHRDPTEGVAGHGNLWNAASIFAFAYDCSCSQPFVTSKYPARWIVPELRLEIALGFDPSTENQKHVN